MLRAGNINETEKLFGQHDHFILLHFHYPAFDLKFVCSRLLINNLYCATSERRNNRRVFVQHAKRTIGSRQANGFHFTAVQLLIRTYDL